MAQLVEAYTAHASEYYRRPDGACTSEIPCVRQAMRFVVRLFASSRADDFDVFALRACRDAMIASGLTRNTVNGYTRRIQRLFRWAASEGLVDGSSWQALLSLEGLRRGRSRAKERDPVRPVPLNDVRAVQAIAAPMIAAMIDLQVLTGMRPGEVVSMQVDEIDFSSLPWMYRPRHHKTAHLDRSREIALGPRAREVLRPWIRLDARLWSIRGRSCLFPIRRDSYRRIVAKLCSKAGVPIWSPNQLRHLAATVFRRELGIEATRALLGHASLSTSEIYAEADRSAIARAMERLG